MPRRSILTAAQREELLAFPDDESELIRLYTLSSEDLRFVRAHRGGHNQLGIAVQMCYLRYPGHTLTAGDTPYAPLLGIVAAQLDVPPGLWDHYANRDETRREHVAELLTQLGLESFRRSMSRELVTWLTPLAMQTTQGYVLAQALVTEFRARQIVLPPIRVLELLCAQAATRAQREVFRLLTEPLTAEHREALDNMLVMTPGRSMSLLAWVRQPPAAPGARSMMAHIERLKAVRALNLPAAIGQTVHQNRLLRLAREGAQTAAHQIEEYEAGRRYATLVAIAMDTMATLTDEIIDLNDRLMGSFFTKARNRFAKDFAESGKAINDKVRLFDQIGTALIDARTKGTDPFAAIESILSWEEFTATVQEASKLARDESFDHLRLVGDYYSQLRRYEPTFLSTFEFRGGRVVESLLAAVDCLRNMNDNKLRKLPESAPTEFLRKRWASLIYTEQGIERKFYEFAVMSELKNALRSGDESVVGSRQFKDFDEYLLPKSTFADRLRTGQHGLAIATNASTYLAERLEQLRTELDHTARLAESGELPDATLKQDGLKITPLGNEVPDTAEAFKAKAFALLPHVKITDLLLEVDQWTNFTEHFGHLKTERAAPDRSLLLTAVLADALNLGLYKMAEACPSASVARLSRLAAWHIRDETYSRSLAELINYQHQLPFAAHWGEGTSSSSDGQRYRAGGRGESSGAVNAKYGNDPGVLFYTHISDQYAPFHTKVISATVRDATHVLDGLLYHESDLRIEEHFTDTAGFTNHVFALCHLLGFRFAPRIRGLGDHRIFVPGAAAQWPSLSPLIGGSLNTRLIEQQFDEVLRLASSIKTGTVTASLILRKLGAYPRQNSLARALREVGRLERTLFTLKWLQDPALRRRTNAGLNKGEARNALARAVFLHRLGEIRDRSYENQRYRASGLNLVVAAITLWNTVYLERAVSALREQGAVDDSLLPHLSPLGWDHINLTGDYSWHTNKRVAKGRFRPLRTPKSTTPRP